MGIRGMGADQPTLNLLLSATTLQSLTGPTVGQCG